MVYKYSTKDLVKKLIDLLKSYKYQLLLAICLIIISIVLSVYAPKLLGKIINSIYSYKDAIDKFPIVKAFDALFIIIILYLISYLIRIHQIELW